MENGIKVLEDEASYIPLQDDEDDSRLKQLGYKPELSRSLSAISNFAVTFSIISVLTGLTTTFNTGIEFGGPLTMVYGWLIAGFFTLIVGLAMAEICSSYPTSGGLYFWSAKLCGNEWAPFASWLTGCMTKEHKRSVLVHLLFWLEMVSKREVMPISSHVPNGGAAVDSGQSRLNQLGYKQELKRDLSVFSNFAISFSIISVLTGVTTLYNTGLRFGGSIVMVYGWFIAGFFTLIVGYSMAEICSSFPTSGGLYYWSAKLAGPKWAPFASWLTGWFNIVGQWAVTTSIDFSLAQLLQVIILLSTGGHNGGGYEASKYVVICFHAGILFIHALINSLPITLLSFFGQLSALWNVVGVFVLMILIPLVSTERASAKFVFTHFNTDNGDGIQNKFYIFVLGLLMSQYTLTGYDASAHMRKRRIESEWTKGIISAIGISIIVGWGYILGITFAVTDVPHLLSSDNDAGGYAIAQLQATPGDQFFTGISKRVYFWMSYAFSRDGAMPFSSSWHKVNKHEVPINAVWFSAFISFCMALTSLWSLVAFQAMVSIATIGLYISYALPIFFRVTLARKYFVPGPFNLGRFGVLVGWIAVLWVATITVLFSLPVSYPVTKDTLNYTPVAVGGLLILTVGSWILSARHWFRGPITNLDI
ncbi:hypothetical protein IFM89_027405 [Coptis chinensis]|uniref:Uncharacterized protein n=1 Tax=Coptis chinensis TaxID=261450 RepID=A0A835H9B9_9MAGN|nr:hypothetical protein IFM89_027405 [Coptis chinensis]